MISTPRKALLYIVLFAPASVCLAVFKRIQPEDLEPERTPNR